LSKTAKHITTFEGGLVNAVEASDVGDENGLWNIENLEGIFKKGVLLPSGSVSAVHSSYVGSGANQSAGVGFECMQGDYKPHEEVVVWAEFNHSIPSPGAVNISLGDFQTDWVKNWSFTYQLIDVPTSGDGVHIEFLGTSYNGSKLQIVIPEDPHSTGSTWFEEGQSYRIYYSYRTPGIFPNGNSSNNYIEYENNHPNPYVGTTAVVSLPSSQGDTVLYNGDEQYFFHSSAASWMHAVTVRCESATSWGVSHAGERKYSLNLHATERFQDGSTLYPYMDNEYILEAIKIKKINEYVGTQYFLCSNSTGQVAVFEDGAGTATTSLQVQIPSIDDNDPDYLFTSNAIRVCSSQFGSDNKDYLPKYFGFISRDLFPNTSKSDIVRYMEGKFVKPVGGGNISGTINVHTWQSYAETSGISGSHNNTIQIRGWHNLDAGLKAPDEDYCTMVNQNDYFDALNFYIGATLPGSLTLADDNFYDGDSDKGNWPGMDLMAGQGHFAKHISKAQTDDPGYLIRLEYRVNRITTVGSDINITGTWNEARDTTDPKDDEIEIVYRFYTTFVYDGGSQESTMTRISRIAPIGAALENGQGSPHWARSMDYAYLSGHAEDEIALQFRSHSGGGTISNTLSNAWDTSISFRPVIYPGNKGLNSYHMPARVTGVNFYYSSSQDDHYGRYLLINCDFLNGLKFYNEANPQYRPWNILRHNWLGMNCSKSSSYENHNYSVSDWSANYENRFPIHEGFSYSSDPGYQTMIEFKDPPKFEDWNSIYGINPDEWPKIKYKTSVIINNQAFYGNVEVDGEIDKEKILVSISDGGYDMVPKDNYIDMTTGDGDEIVKLLTYSGKLYVFKKRKLEIVEVEEETDSITNTFATGGVESKHHAVVTSIGCIWANEFGVFLHDGSAITNLIFGKVNTFSLNNTDNFVVGYSPRDGRVYILDKTVTSQAKTLWMIDIETKTWWISNTQFETAFAYSNFSVDKNLQLIWMKDVKNNASGMIQEYWNNLPAGQDVSFEIGDLNLDGVTSNKQLYSVVVSAKNAGSLTITGNYTAPNGTQTSLSFGTSTLSSSSTGFGRTTHIVTPNTAEDITFVSVTISGTAVAGTEIHSVSFVYRDKGVK
jgi:hypothetical protein